jgi:hypothetical protein
MPSGNSGYAVIAPCIFLFLLLWAAGLWKRQKKRALKADSGSENSSLEGGSINGEATGVAAPPRSLRQAEWKHGNNKLSGDIEMQRLDPEAITTTRRRSFRHGPRDSDYSAKEMDRSRKGSPVSPMALSRRTSTDVGESLKWMETPFELDLFRDPNAQIVTKAIGTSAITNRSLALK